MEISSSKLCALGIKFSDKKKIPNKLRGHLSVKSLGAFILTTLSHQAPKIGAADNDK